MRSRRIHLWTTGLVAIGWVAALAVGIGGLLSYENAPGPVAAVPGAWPDSRISRASDQPTLVMMAHPHCPCTRASIGELAKVMAEVQGKVAAHVLFSTPANGGDDWQDTGLRRSAAAIPGVIVSSDVDGAEARRFGAETSGHTLLFAADGRLLFSGGITQSRGHAGDNVGASAIVSLADNKPAPRASTFVFGCSLPDKAESASATAVAAR